MDPHETRIVPFTPHPLSNIRKGDHVLISESKDPLIHVIPSRFKAFSLSTTPLAAFVTNLSDKVYTGKVHAQTQSRRAVLRAIEREIGLVRESDREKGHQEAEASL